MKAKSYSQKADAMFKTLSSHPDMTATQVYNKYKGTPLGMRKTDSLELAKAFKEEIKLRDKFVDKVVNHTNMMPSTKIKLSKAAGKVAYKHAKNNTRRGQIENKAGIKYGGVQILDNKTFSRHAPNADMFYEFY